MNLLLVLRIRPRKSWVGKGDVLAQIWNKVSRIRMSATHSTATFGRVFAFYLIAIIIECNKDNNKIRGY